MGAGSTVAPVFAVPAGSLAVGRVLLAGPEGRHAAAVRRLGVGERLDLVDGLGARGTGVVAAVVGPAELAVDLSAVTVEPVPALRLAVAQALPKGERGELAVELLTEAGVDEIVPWQAARCVAQWSGPRGERSLERWRSTAREAGKQSRRARWPVVAAALGTPGLAARAASATLAVLLEAGVPASLATLPLPDAGEVLLLVGPEGGVGEAERAALLAAGVLEARLGSSVLRTSTAGVVALSVVSARGRWA